MAFPKPSASQVRFQQVHLDEQTIENLAPLFGKQGQSKTSYVFRAIVNEQGITTNYIRMIADCSNVPSLVSDINKKLMNKGLMIIRIDPVGVPPNAAFHHWFLVEAPISNIYVDGLASNDPRFDK